MMPKSTASRACRPAVDQVALVHVGVEEAVIERAGQEAAGDGDGEFAAVGAGGVERRASVSAVPSIQSSVITRLAERVPVDLRRGDIAVLLRDFARTRRRRRLRGAGPSRAEWRRSPCR